MKEESYVSGLKELVCPYDLGQMRKIAISGHVRPDGDCVGSCLGLCSYLLEHYPDHQVDVYLDPIPLEFNFLRYADKIRQMTEEDSKRSYDLCIALDCSDPDRLNQGRSIFESAAHTLCIDHHITNQGFGETCIVCPESSSASELLYYLLKQYYFGEGAISCDCAQSLYMGIVHDTGVFKHSNTRWETMTAAGELISYGLNTEKIINDTFYKKTYIQNRLLGHALLESCLLLDGSMIYSCLSQRDFDRFSATKADSDGIIDQLRVTEGVHVAMLLTETEEGDYKISLRSDELVDVSAIAACYGGGGHIRAAGCTISADLSDIVSDISGKVALQLSSDRE